MRRAAVGATLGLLLLLVGLLAPASAQDGGSPPPQDDGQVLEGETTTEEDGSVLPVDDSGSDGFELAVDNGSAASNEGVGAGGPDDNVAVDDGAVEPEPEPEPEPGLVQLGDESVEILAVDSTAYPRVGMIVSVPPALAGELTSGNFAMTEGNVVVPDLSAVKLRDAIEVVIVVDTSGSMSGDPMAAAISAAKNFVNELEPNTRIAVIGFGETASTVATFDDSRADVLSSLDGLVADGKTALYDALIASTNELGDGEARRFVVVLSDGADTASQASLGDAADVLVDNEVNLYAITLDSAEANFSGLRQVVSDADGRLVSAADTESLNEVYGALASRLSNQYQLTFTSRFEGPVPVSVSVAANGALGLAQDKLEFKELAFTPGVAPGASGVDEPLTRPEATGGSGPTTETAAATGFFNSTNALYAGLGALFLALLGIFGLLFTFERLGSSQGSAFSKLDLKNVKKGSGGLSGLGDRASSLAESAIKNNSRSKDLDELLERGGLEMRPGEFVTAAVGAAFGLAALGFALFGIFGLPGGFLVGLWAARFFVKFKAGQREKLFAKQLGDTLIMMAGSLRAGHGIADAIDSVATQAEAPTSEEFSRVVSEARIGRDLVESLYDVASRTKSEDFIWVVRAIAINRELGGDLAEILDNVGDTIRDRMRLRDQVKALSAEGKISAFVLVMLPIGVTGWVRISNPEYLASMTDETAGKFAVGFACFLLTAGIMWLRKLINVEF